MFKPLLRVLPSISGNISLNCYIDNIVKTKIKNEYEVSIQHAGIIPLQNALYRTNNEILYDSSTSSFNTEFSYFMNINFTIKS